MAAIFFSHASHDDALASEIEAWLNNKGFDDIFLDHGSIRSGDKWTEALRRAGGSCRVVLSLVTPGWLASSECFGEFTAGWYAGRRMIPLICTPGATLDDMQKQRLSRVLLEDQGVDIARAGAPSALDLDAHPHISGPLIEGLRAAGALAKVGLDPLVFSIEDQRDGASWVNLREMPRNHFGELIDAACIAPVGVARCDKPFVVVMAVEKYERLTERKNEKKPSRAVKARGSGHV